MTAPATGAAVAVELWRVAGGLPSPREGGGAPAAGNLRHFDDVDEPSTRLYLREHPAGRPPASAPSGAAWLAALPYSDRGERAAEGAFLLAVGFAVPDDAVSRFDDWYESEHSRLLLQAPGWLQIRRYTVTAAVGVDWTHLALHDLASLDALGSPERATARQGPKRLLLAEEAWYGRGGRWLGRSLAGGPG